MNDRAVAVGGPGQVLWATGGSAPASVDDNLSDEWLLRAAQDGAAGAMALLVTRFERPLYRMLLGLTGRPAVAEDLLQDTFVRLVRQPVPLDHVAGWLYRCAENLAIDHARRRGREHLMAEPPEPSAPSDDWTDRIVDRERLAAAVAQLTLEQRQAIALHYFADQPLADVARILGVPLGTVKTRLHRAYRRLAALLAPDDDTDPLGSAGPTGIPSSEGGRE